jgi:methionine-rich copper-binding protein CopC/putative copper export protein
LSATRLLGAVVALGVLLGIGPAAASAHPLLISASPQPGVVAGGAPATISVALTEPTVARGSGIRLFGADGQRLAVGAVQASNGRRTLSVRPRRPLRSAVYTVRWSALGDDGHVVTSSFNFGIAGADGAPPAGVEKLTGAGGGRGGETAAGDSIVKIAGRWLGILAASMLFGGFVLLARLRHRRDPDDLDTLRTIAPLLWLLVAFAALEGILAGADSGAGGGGGLDFSLLTASATGVSELVRAGLVVSLSLVLAFSAERPRFRDQLYLGGGAAVLTTYALSGHVLSFPSFWALLDQGLHVLAAGLWLGGLIALLILATRDEVRIADGARAFAPVAGPALGLAIVTGVLAAVREVDRWFFLRWSDYGRIVIIKAVLVALVSLAGAAAWWRSRGDGSPGPRPLLLRAESAGVVGILVLAATLSGLAQGRGQPLPSQRGSLFAGPAFATALLPEANAPVVLAPGRTGANVLAVSIAPGQPTPRRVLVRLTAPGGSGRSLNTALRTHGGLTWSAPVSVPSDGTWFAYVTVDGRTAPPVQLSVGIPRIAGAPPVQLLSVADLSGPAAERCRAHVIGLEFAIARLNASGGLDGGRKVVPLVLDSGGSAAGAAAAAARGLAAHPIASVGDCGSGAVAAVEAASKAAVPSIVGDPSVDPTAAKDVFRLAADPYAQGLAFGQLVRNRISSTGDPGVNVVRADLGRDLQSQRLLAGLRVGLRDASAVRGAPVGPRPEPRLVLIRQGSLAGLSRSALTKILLRSSTTAFILDGPGQGGADAAAIEHLGAVEGAEIAPAPLLFSERVLSETAVRQAGPLGRIGAVQGVSEVSTATPQAELYQGALPLLFRGDIASVDGLRGYVAGLALLDAIRSGTDRAAIVRHLHAPSVFSTALLAPWSARRPGAGSPAVLALQPQFLSPTLTPTEAGGEEQDSAYFPQGNWTITSQTPLGAVGGLSVPRLGQP